MSLSRFGTSSVLFPVDAMQQQHAYAWWQFQQFYFADSSVHRMLPRRAHAPTSSARLSDAVREVSACTFAVDTLGREGVYSRSQCCLGVSQ